MNLIRIFNEFKNYDEGVGKNVENSKWIYRQFRRTPAITAIN